MKKVLLASAIVCMLGSRLAAQAIPDGGFESWVSAVWMDPVFYTTSNDQGNGENASYGIPFNVTRVAGKYGNYGVQLSTIKYNNDTIGAFMIDGNPNNSGGISGGIPYNQKPTGIRFWYKYTTSGIDTAAVLAIFKKSGSPIDSFLILIPSSQSASTYTLRSYYPIHPLPITPDTVVFGALSSKAMISNHGNYSTGIIPGSTLVIDSVTFTGVASQPAELNGNFENWTSDTLNYPGGWYISSPGVTFTTDHHAGKYALQLETVNSPSKGEPQQGQASTGYWPNCSTNCNEEGGFPYTKMKDTLEFWYKYAPELNDTASVALQFVKNGQQINCCSGISIFAPTTVWTYTTIPFDYGTAPDSVIVNIYSSSHSHDTTNSQYLPYVGSILKIDNLAFASQKSADLGVAQIPAAGGIRIYPNPASTQINIDLSAMSGSLETIVVYDMSGRALDTQDYSGRTSNTIEIMNISNYAPGIYLIEVTTDTGRFYQKIVKE